MAFPGGSVVKKPPANAEDVTDVGLIPGLGRPPGGRHGKCWSVSHVQFFVTPWTVAHQAPLSMGFFRQEYRSGLPFPSPGDLPDPGIKPGSPASQVHLLPSEPPRKPLRHGCPLQYSCLENPMDRGAWWTTVHGVTKSQIRLKRLSAHTPFYGWGMRGLEIL